MYVDVSNLKSFLVNLNVKLKEYEADCLNFYNELNHVSSCWVDPHASAFFDEVKQEEYKMDTMQLEMKNVYDIYHELAVKYGEFGNKIFFDLEKRNAFFSKVDDYINKLDGVIQSYSRLDLSFGPSEAGRLNREKESLKSEKKELQTLKEDYKKTFLRIEEIEKNIHYRVSKIDIEVLKQGNIQAFFA